MSYYYFYNPKIYIDPGWVGLGDNLNRRICRDSQYTDEICQKTDNLLKDTAKIAFSSLKDDKLQELKKTRDLEAKQIQEMQEEEDLMIYLLLH